MGKILGLGLPGVVVPSPSPPPATLVWGIRGVEVDKEVLDVFFRALPCRIDASKAPLPPSVPLEVPLDGKGAGEGEGDD